MPNVRFFERVITETSETKQAKIAYAGDRLGNGVEPGRQAGMVLMFLRRAPWALIQSGFERFSHPIYVIESLSSLPDMPPDFDAFTTACDDLRVETCIWLLPVPE